MIINNSYISKGGSEDTLECEFKEKHTITLADAKRLGLYGLEEDAFPIEFSDDELIEFLSQKLAAIKYASYILQFSDKSEKVLRHKLKDKGFCPEVIDAALQVLNSSGIISDENLCLRRYITIATSKLYGPARIKNELFAKGFSCEDIKNAQLLADINFSSLLEELCDKLLSSGKTDLSDRKQYDKFYAKLVRYGYGFEDIRRVLESRKANDYFDEYN